MRLELRKTSDHVCETCGAHDLLSVHDLPLTRDLSEFVELEVLRREVRLARAFRDAHEDAVAEAARREFQNAEAHQQEMRELVESLEGLLSSSKIDIVKWRLFRRHREKIFAERIDGIISAMLSETRYGVASYGEKDRS